MSLRKLYSLTLTYFLKVKKNINIIEMVRAISRNAWDDFHTFLYLPSKVNIMEIINRDLDLLLEGKHFGTLLSETYRACAKMGRFYNFLYLPSKDNSTKIVVRNLDLLFKVKKMHSTTFVDFDIFQQMTPLRSCTR